MDSTPSIAQQQESFLTPEQQEKLQKAIDDSTCSTYSLTVDQFDELKAWYGEIINKQEFIHCTTKEESLKSSVASMMHMRTEVESVFHAAARALIDPVLNVFGNDPAENPDDQVDSPAVKFLSYETTTRAFQADYKEHGGEDAFWRHLELQKQAFDEECNEKFPYFAIVQSSGYGKSRLIKHLQSECTKGTVTGSLRRETPKIIYFSFAASEAYPKSNVTIDHDLQNKKRESVEEAFCSLFEEALSNPEKENFNLAHMTESSGTKRDMNKVEKGEEVVFVLDEISQLLKHFAHGNVTFFKCFQTATVKFLEIYSDCFFVTLAREPSTNSVMPGIKLDPSCNVLVENNNENRSPMAPFLMLEAIGLRNDETTILQLAIDVCHQPKHLFAMGRPIWQAYSGTLSDEEFETYAPKLVKFALAKLLATSSSPSPAELSQEQCLALFVCRACLTVSPVSWLASALVSSHMATAIGTSQDRDGVTVAYPSEPILAIAARSYMCPFNHLFWQVGIQHLKDAFLSGAVPKSQCEEVIVRALNLIAMDKAMKITGHCEEVQEVDLVDFLSQFDRDGAEVSALTGDNLKSTTVQRKILEGEGVLRGKDFGVSFPPSWKGTVCFTHFASVARTPDNFPLITPNLLRYAYRRTAALAIDDGRRGIDWIIPVRVGEDEFVGLCGQDKNRMGDILESLVPLTNDESYHNVTAEYFLTAKEKKLFLQKGWNLNWPAIVFSIGAEKKGAALAMRAIRRRRSSGTIVQYPFPCIVLTGLGYHSLMNDEANSLLGQLQDAVVDVPDVYQEKVPLIYGCQSDRMDEIQQTDSN